MACGICLLSIAAATLFEVVSRSFFDSPTLWSQDVSVYLMIWCAFLGLLPTDRAGQHIRIDVWSRRLPGSMQHAIQRISYGVIALFAITAAATGGEVVAQSVRLGRRSMSLFSVPMWLPQSAVVCGMALFAVECVRRALLRQAPPGGSPR
jgi:TRAP-type C4-dicarboxylate transport system permease small subunit